MNHDDMVNVMGTSHALRPQPVFDGQDERLAEGRREDNWCHRRPRDGMGKTALAVMCMEHVQADPHLHTRDAGQRCLLPGSFGVECFCSADSLTKRIAPRVVHASALSSRSALFAGRGKDILSGDGYVPGDDSSRLIPTPFIQVLKNEAIVDPEALGSVRAPRPPSRMPTTRRQVSISEMARSGRR
ncbi:hypothetical protein B0T11DRAFT_27035 [Plectosphaerella cucumerina]|uniref:Uncharacterized protein n=1 Tax=Plectosphaerella cucumerina TaxID=40658 RepID=A0A8K0TU43_9PEZI|nr:hypothetical protein B0T11DRAFT_27035 [Plectosphaerella cucumerina]